jgi:oligoribonuclease NrnB/cAMP/cGMP phosphodiesterase (DHH superfamily)
LKIRPSREGALATAASSADRLGVAVVAAAARVETFRNWRREVDMDMGYQGFVGYNGGGRRNHSGKGPGNKPQA